MSLTWLSIFGLSSLFLGSVEVENVLTEFHVLVEAPCRLHFFKVMISDSEPRKEHLTKRRKVLDVDLSGRKCICESRGEDVGTDEHPARPFQRETLTSTHG